MKFAILYKVYKYSMNSFWLRDVFVFLALCCVKVYNDIYKPITLSDFIIHNKQSIYMYIQVEVEVKNSVLVAVHT